MEIQHCLNHGAEISRVHDNCIMVQRFRDDCIMTWKLCVDYRWRLVQALKVTNMFLQIKYETIEYIAVLPMLCKAGHRSKLAPLRVCVIAATGRRKHTQVDLLWITLRFRTIAAFPINSERLDASVVVTSRLPATNRKSRTYSTRATDVILECKHCSWRCWHIQIEFTSTRKCADKTQTIARKRWHGARIY